VRTLSLTSLPFKSVKPPGAPRHATRSELLGDAMIRSLPGGLSMAVYPDASSDWYREYVAAGWSADGVLVEQVYGDGSVVVRES
jgi:hypothetical protein